MKESEIDNDQNTMFGYCVGGYHMGTRPELESDHCACKRGEPKRKCGSKCFRARETWSSQRTMVALVTGPRGVEARGEDG